MCLLFILVDLGQPARAFYMILYPTPGSMMFWDMVSLNGYLFLNITIAWIALSSERKGIAPPSWLKAIIILSIPWAVSIHTVTAFLYNGLPGRHFWLTAILAPRFLASAFAAGPAFLILLCLILRKFTSFDAGKEPIQKIAVIVAYTATINAFFLLLEVFTVFYSQIPDHMYHFQYLYAGIDGKTALVPWMWTSAGLGLLAIFMLIVPAIRRNEKLLAIACICLFASIWIDKGMGMMVGGFTPSTSHTVVEYTPTMPELWISLSVYAFGLLMLTVFYKIVVSVREQGTPEVCAH
jgi:molybdopterin-containing oxidoreductase family membrane subunit